MLHPHTQTRPQLRKLLDTEAAISLEARAGLEEVHAALAAAQADAAQQLAKLQRELAARCVCVCAWWGLGREGHCQAKTP
jgi:hypothetical protein